MFDAFLFVEGAPGESKDSQHADWIEIHTFQHGAVQPVSLNASSTTGVIAGKASPTPFTIMKPIDKASPKLYEFCVKGQHIKKVILQIYRSGGDKQKYFEITLDEAIIASFDQGGGEGFPVETITFAPGKIHMDYNMQAREGSTLAGSVATSWSWRTNTA